MKAVAGAIGKARRANLISRFCWIIFRDFARTLSTAITRAFHFLHENDRVSRQAAALKSGDLREFLQLANESRKVVVPMVQNCYSPKSLSELGLVLASALTEDALASYEKLMNDVFRDDTVVRLSKTEFSPMFPGQLIVNSKL